MTRLSIWLIQHPLNLLDNSFLFCPRDSGGHYLKGLRVAALGLFMLLPVLSACGNNPDKSATETKRPTMSLTALADSMPDELSCTARQGQWQRVGKLQAFACVLPTSDAGKSCTDGQQCQVACVLKKDQEVAPGTKATGQCHDTTNLFGCQTHVSRGKAEATLCID